MSEDKLTDDLTGRVLSGIRDKIDEVSNRLDKHLELTNRRFDQVEKRFDQLDRRFGRFDQVDRRFDQVETRVITELHAVHATMDSIKVLLVDRLDLRDRVTTLEHDVAALKDRP